MMLAAVQSTSWPSVALGIVVLLLACVGLVAVGHWLLRHLGDLASRGHAHPRDGGRWIVSEDTPPPSPSAAPEPAQPPIAVATAQPPVGGEPPLGPMSGVPLAGEGQGADVTGQERAAEDPVVREPSERPGARCPPGSIERLAGALAVSRLLRGADELVARKLACLPSDRWHVERGVQIPCYRVPFVIVGETGVFAVWGGSAPPSWHHLVYVSRACVEVRALLPGYAGKVHGAYCRALAAEEVRPRWWCQPQTGSDDERRTYLAGPGAWVMDLRWLVPWIEHHSPDAWPGRHGVERGVGVKDLERLRTVARQPPARPPVPPAGKMPFVDTVPNI